MPKMYLKFDLQDDKEVSEIYFNAYNMYQTLSDLKSQIRNMDKWGSQHKTAAEAIEAIHELFYDVANSNNLTIDF